MSDALLKNRDYTVILARDGAKHSPAQPGLEKQWNIAEESIIEIGKKCEEFDTDGIAIYIASEIVQQYKLGNSEKLREILSGDYASEKVNLLAALKAALGDYFNKKANSEAKENGEIIIVILDSEPRERRAIIKLLVQASEQIDKTEELGILFAQVGDDSLTKGFLTALDDDLERAGAKYDIVDTKSLGEMNDSEIYKFLLDAIYD